MDCLIYFFKDYARGLESMKEAYMWMKYSTLSETKSLTFKKEISKNIEFLAEKVSSGSTVNDLYLYGVLLSGYKRKGCKL